MSVIDDRLFLDLPIVLGHKNDGDVYREADAVLRCLDDMIERYRGTIADALYLGHIVTFEVRDITIREDGERIGWLRVTSEEGENA